MQDFEVTAPTIDEAMDKAEQTLRENNFKPDDAEFIVLDSGSKGILGFNKRDAKVLVRIKQLSSDASSAGDFLNNFLGKIIKLMGFEADILVKESEGIISVELIGKDEDIKLLIGRHGCVLDALQDISNVAIQKYAKVKVRLDAGNYRAIREEKLKNYVLSKANMVLYTQQDFELSPMVSHERRIVHEILKDFPGVRTVSVGDRLDRRIIISYHPEKK